MTIRILSFILFIIMFTSYYAAAETGNKCVDGDIKVCTSWYHSAKQKCEDPATDPQYKKAFCEAYGYPAALACKAGSNEMCVMAGQSAQTGKGWSKVDLPSAKRDYKIGCDRGHQPSCQALGALTGKPMSRAGSDMGALQAMSKSPPKPAPTSPQSPQSLKELPLSKLMSLCDSGGGEACAQYGLKAQKALPEGQRGEIYRIYEKGCAFEDGSRACTLAAIGYDIGSEVPKDLEKSERYHRRACYELGFADGCSMLAGFYLTSKSRSYDAVQANKMACRLGSQPVCDALNAAGINISPLAQ